MNTENEQRKQMERTRHGEDMWQGRVIVNCEDNWNSSCDEQF